MNEKVLSSISDKVLDVALIIKTLRDASLGSDNYAYAHVLDIALKEQFNIYEELELMY